jgi:tetratricopeptide (TPR) repeat protein
VLAEGVFTALDWGRTSDYDDPFVGFSSVRPLFVPSDDGQRYEIPVARQGYFCSESFSARKPANEFRIFCLGGSTVQGNPFAIETSFTTWLEISLQTAAPERKWEVVNCGGISYASYRLLPILEEVLTRQADLIIVYTGQNEFLEDRTYGHIKYTPAVLARAQQTASQLRTFTLLREGLLRLRGRSTQQPLDQRPILPNEVEALLDFEGGLNQYHRDDKWRQDVMVHYDYNLRRMVQLAHDAGVPLLLMNPVCNLRDCPPFKSEHRAGMTAADLANWESLWEQARQLYASDLPQAQALLEQALAIDDQHAGLHYELAKCYETLGQAAEARREYILAKEMDICPLRILEPMNDIVLRVAQETGTPLVDVRKLIEQQSRDGIPGGYLLVDHVHPSITGHQLIADALLDELVRQGTLTPIDGWKHRRDETFREHLLSLDSFYFLKGERHLNALRNWAAGRATRLPATPPESASN